MKDFDYFEPENLEQAFALLERYQGQARILAGGTDLVPQMKRGILAPAAIVSLGKIPELQEIRVDEEGLFIGAMVSLGALQRHPSLVSRYRALRDALSNLAVPAIRTLATLGGNVCLDTKCIYRDQVRTWERALEPCLKMGGKRCYVVREGKKCHASLAADTVPALIALHAQARVLSPAGERTVPLESVYTGNGIKPINLKSQEILARIFLPAQRGEGGSAYHRFSWRKALDFPLASAAVSVKREDDICTEARIVLGGVAPGPVVLLEAEALLKAEALKTGAPSYDLFRQVAHKTQEEAIRITRSGRMDDFTGRIVAVLVYQSLGRAWSSQE
jgi:4-hydroxybenzoyl-CoA reductase subunit beta